MFPASELVARFAADLDALVDPEARLGVAVSGGPDSLALLLLAEAARPRRVVAATVDHRLREGSAAEAERVAELSRTLRVPHTILTLDWPKTPSGNIQSKARDRRYAALGTWAAAQKLVAVATAHHLDDQAETVLLRLARGAGIGGLAGVQPSRAIHEACPAVRLVRPLLSWRRTTLAKVVASAGLEPVDDPTNRDARFDRTHARALLASTPWLDAERVSAVAGHAADAQAALEFTTAELLADRMARDDGVVRIRASDLPDELQRRLLLKAMALLSDGIPAGPQVGSALERLRAGCTTTLCGLKMSGGETWTLRSAPARSRQGKA